MTLAVLSFATRKTPGRVMLRCDDLALDEARDLEPSPPFARWTGAYESGYWTREALLGIGLAIGTWLEGPQRWLSRLAQATAPVILVIETTRTPDPIEQAALDAPWELIARATSERESRAFAPPQGDESVPAPVEELLQQLGPVDWQNVQHLAFEPSVLLSVVRRLGKSAAPLEPSKYRLSVVFMPCQPDGSAGISVDQERAILKATDSLEMHLEVEDSGSLSGLGDLIAQLGEYDVLQVSCPAMLAPSPALAFEGPRGERVDVSADDIWNQIGQLPRLLVVSAYGESGAGPVSPHRSARGAATVASRVLGPLSTQLCQRGWPAVIALAGATAAQVEIDLAVSLYWLLSQRISLLEAFARALRLVEDAAAGTLWHGARLVLGPRGGGQIVDGAGVNPPYRLFIQNKQFLDSNGQIPLATDYQTSLHRRAFQRVMAMLRNAEFPGIAVHGSDERSRATFVSRVLRCMKPALRRVVLTADFDALTILQTIREQTANSAVADLVKEYDGKLREDPSQLQDVLRAIVEGPCRDSGGGAFVLVLHNFHPTPGRDHVVLWALLGAFAGADTASRLVITCSVLFSATDDVAIDIVSEAAGVAGAVGVAGARLRGLTSSDRHARHRETSATLPHPIARTAGDRVTSRRLRSLRILVACIGVALAGLGVVHAVIRIRTGDGAVAIPHGVLERRDPASAAPPGMVRFEAADIHMAAALSEMRPEGCTKLLVEGRCQHLLSSDTIEHVAAFFLDTEEVTNEDFYAWLNAHRKRWVPNGLSTIVWERVEDTEIPLISTQCLEYPASPPGDATPLGQAQTTAASSKLPVTCVTWYGATSYCRDQRKRLPLESEWQLAAKGTEGRSFPWGNDPPRPGHVAYELDGPRAVGTSSQDVSPEGIHDLAGNASEWVQSRAADPMIEIVRGGSFLSTGACTLLSSRCARVEWYGFLGRNVGFRCARSVDGSETRNMKGIDDATRDANQ